MKFHAWKEDAKLMIFSFHMVPPCSTTGSTLTSEPSRALALDHSPSCRTGLPQAHCCVLAASLATSASPVSFAVSLSLRESRRRVHGRAASVVR